MFLGMTAMSLVRGIILTFSIFAYFYFIENFIVIPWFILLGYSLGGLAYYIGWRFPYSLFNLREPKSSEWGEFFTGYFIYIGILLNYILIYFKG